MNLEEIQPPISRRAVGLKTALTEGRAIADYLPDAYTPALVHCLGFTCLAYLDERFIWRGRYNDEPIPEKVIAWEPL